MSSEAMSGYGSRQERDYKKAMTIHLARAQRGRCAYCGEIFDGDRPATFDHIDPRGPDSLENYALACRSCNSRKRNRNLDEYREYLSVLAIREKLPEEAKFSMKSIQWLMDQEWFPWKRQKVLFWFEANQQ